MNLYQVVVGNSQITQVYNVAAPSMAEASRAALAEVNKTQQPVARSWEVLQITRDSIKLLICEGEYRG